MKLSTYIRRQVNTKFAPIHRAFGDTAFRLLDVGAGNRSASKTLATFPHCEYHGLDMDKATDYIQDDFKAMKAFYELDLTKLDYAMVPDSYFDYINMAHVIEHLHNGDEVLPMLLQKLKPGGYFYIEYPGPKSMHLPSMYGTLNFHDDPTHVRLYSIEELKPLFEAHHCHIIRCGTRRNVYYLLATPFRALWYLLRGKRINANVFWDLLGFAEYLFVQKKG